MNIRKLTVAFAVAALVGLAAWSVASSALGAPAGEAAMAKEPAREAAPSPGAAADTTPQAADGFEWFWAINGPVSADGGVDISVDEDGSVFLAGSHGGLDMDRDGVVDIESGATAYKGARNPFFMKLSRGPADDRVRLRWTRSPRTPADRSGTKIAADGRGGAYVSGAFQESLSFEGGPTLPGAGGNDAYVARYDGEGSVIWASVFGGPGSDAIYDVASDREGNAYAVGQGTGTFPLDERGAEFRATGERAAVFLSYGPEGAVRWAKTLGSGVPFAVVVEVAPSGEIFVTGELDGAADFDDDGAIDLPAPKNRDGFVARFDAEGAFLGAWTVGAGLVALAFGREGDVFLGGMMGGPAEERYGPADFDGDGRADVEIKGGGPTGAWVARYSPEGDLRWVRSYALEQLADIKVRGGHIAVPGHYKGVRDLDEDGEPERVDRTVDPSLETDLAILILSAVDGRPERVWTAPGPGNDWANAVAFSPKEPALYVTGSVQLTADFTGDGEDGEGWALCENLGDVFFAQYRLWERRAITLEVTLAASDEGLEVSLAWLGAATAEIDVYRDGERIATTANDGSHLDLIPRGQVALGYMYRVCEPGTNTCSGEVEASFLSRQGGG